MTTFRLFMFVFAFVAIHLCVGLVGHVWDIEGIKLTRFGLFACILLCLAGGFTFWVERQERKERRDEQKPPVQ